jgi:ankyrin repeat protein
MDKNPTNLFYRPIIEGDLFKVIELVNNGADVNNANLLPLHLAVSTHQRAIAEYLLKNGASIEARDSNGFTALHLSAFQVDSMMTDLLISAGANVSARDNYGNTPLHIAASLDRISPLKSLVDAGADITAKDAEGRTPLEVARVFSQRLAEDLLATFARSTHVQRVSDRPKMANDGRAT